MTRQKSFKVSFLTDIKSPVSTQQLPHCLKHRLCVHHCISRGLNISIRGHPAVFFQLHREDLVKAMIYHSSDNMTPFSDDLNYDYDNSESEEDINYSDVPFYDEDLRDWSGPLSPIPGFGFFPEAVKDELEEMTQVGGIIYIG